MALPSILLSNTKVELKSAPINPAWIVEGMPTARNAELSRSRDGTACTLIWDCTPGKFMWHYDTEETIHILEGSIVLDDGNAPARRLGSGDVVFFPAGAKVHWTVEEHVRKLAFFRRPLPKPLEVVVRGLRQARHAVKRTKAQSAGWMGEPAVAAASVAAGTIAQQS